MYNTNFSNASGINDPDNYSTARDILIISEYLIRNFPDFTNILQKKNLHGIEQEEIQSNREIDPLLYKNMGVDGIKTGYLAVEKYSLASSLLRNGRRLIAVGSGFNTKNSRSKS